MIFVKKRSDIEEKKPRAPTALKAERNLPGAYKKKV